MAIRQTTFAAAFALAAIGPAHAEGLKPLQGQVIDLGDVSGVAYYTVERDGFRVVATLAKKDADAVPVERRWLRLGSAPWRVKSEPTD